MANDGPSLRDNLDQLLAIVRRSLKFLWIGAIVAVLGIALTIIVALTRGQAYVSETAILYREIIPKAMMSDPGSSSSNRSLSIRFREMLFARPLLQKAVEKNELFGDMVAAGDVDEAVEELRDNIQFRERGGNTFRIRYRGHTAREAQQVTASLARLLLDWEKEIELEAVTITREFFTTERERADLELSGAEYVLAQFLSEHPEFALENKPNAGDEGGTTVGASIRAQEARNNARPERRPAPRAASSPELRALERQRDRLKQRLGQLAVAARTAPRSDRPSPELVNARRDYERAATTLVDLAKQFTERHPDVIRARARVTAAKSLLDSLQGETTSEPIATDPDERERLSEQLSEIDGQLAAMRRKLAAATDPNPERPKKVGADYVVELEAEYARLVRKVGEARSRYRTIESKWHTSEMAAASEVAKQGTQLTIIDPAHLPMHPAGAPTKLLLMLGTMASLGFGLVVVLALGSLDDRIFAISDLAPLESGSIGVVIPRLAKGLVVSGKPHV
jgi:uncharacterized protein involved in exopolysaccharide biosynthesis